METKLDGNNGIINIWMGIQEINTERQWGAFWIRDNYKTKKEMEDNIKIHLKEISLTGSE